MEFDLIEPYIKYGAIIVGIISFMITFFNKEHVRYEKNKEKYFNNFLIDFYNAYRNNSNINIRKFFIKNYSYLDTYIPAYVRYLIEKKEFNKAKKVLVADYFFYYPSFRNTVKNIFYKIFNYTWFIEYCIFYMQTVFVFFMGLVLVPMIISDIIGRVNNTHYSSINNIPAPLFMICMLAVLGLLAFIMKFILDLDLVKKDIYTYDRKSIEKIVKLKEKEYIKLKKKVYFL